MIKKIFYNLIIFLIIFVIITITVLSTAGIETDKFNKIITEKINEKNFDFENLHIIFGRTWT